MPHRNPHTGHIAGQASAVGREEAELGLYFYNARWYDPSLGRFTQPNSPIPNLVSPQDWDRYAYVRNNPVNYNDPTGHWIDAVVDGIFIGADIYDIKQNGWNWENGLALAADVVGAAIPIATGLGLGVHAAFKAARAADKAVDAVKLINKVDGAAETVGKLQDLTQVAAKVDDVSRSQDAIGGVYRLVDQESGVTMRTGRTNNLIRREAEHARNPDLSDFKFEPVWKTDNYAEQRGLEQILHVNYAPPLNKINPISPQNPKLTFFKDAAEKYLKEIR